MTWSQAKIIANKITNQELYQTLKNAKIGIVDWNRPSRINKGLSWGCAWNIMCKDFDIKKAHSEIYKVQLIRLFGEWLPEHLKPIAKKKIKPTNWAHQEPDFSNWKDSQI